MIELLSISNIIRLGRMVYANQNELILPNSETAPDHWFSSICNFFLKKRVKIHFFLTNIQIFRSGYSITSITNMIQTFRLSHKTKTY